MIVYLYRADCIMGVFWIRQNSQQAYQVSIAVKIYMCCWYVVRFGPAIVTL